MSTRVAAPDVEGGLEIFREAIGRRWWRIRLADPPNDTGWHFRAYLHRKADGVALSTPTTDVSAEGRAAIDGRIRHLERVARLVWDRHNKGVCIRCGKRHEGDRHEGSELLPEGDAAWTAPVRAASGDQVPVPGASTPPDVEGGLEIQKWERAWLVRAVPIAGRWAAFGSANRKRDARALRTVLLDEVPGRDFAAMFNEHGEPVDVEASRPVFLRLLTIGDAANWVAWRQRNGVCLECGMRSCGSVYTGACKPDGEVDRFRGGRIPAELRRWAS